MLIADYRKTILSYKLFRVRCLFRCGIFHRAKKMNPEAIVVATGCYVQAQEEKGEVDFAYSIPEIGRFRVNAFKQRGSYAAVLRLVGTQIPSAESLGVPPSVIELTKKKRGLVLVTGPTGSGKSTTLAAIIDKINKNRDAHIITLEDPIEYGITGISQIPINTTEGGSFADGLRSVLRLDPDVVMVGEIRDSETAQLAVQAALTGHLVFSTLHTLGAAKTIDRLIFL